MRVLIALLLMGGSGFPSVGQHAPCWRIGFATIPYAAAVMRCWSGAGSVGAAWNFSKVNFASSRQLLNQAVRAGVFPDADPSLVATAADRTWVLPAGGQAAGSVQASLGCAWLAVAKSAAGRSGDQAGYRVGLCLANRSRAA